MKRILQFLVCFVGVLLAVGAGVGVLQLAEAHRQAAAIAGAIGVAALLALLWQNIIFNK